ncbi:MAG: hypothetical protein M0042_11545 [Nitrospiraceae bacterium]|nr:hypothetical protein [Nitrospiraceae bacterium]
MSLSNPLVISAMLFLLLGLIFLVVTIATAKKKKIIATIISLLVALLMLSLSALFGTITVAIQGYRALTREDLAALVKVEPLGPQQFRATIILADGSRKTFSLAGDELYVDAHILKWKPWVNILGLHTSYELDRVSGRYAAVSDETSKVHTVFSLAADKSMDMFEIRKKFRMLNPLLDAEYGSATFINTNSAEEFQVLVSTSGLLIRKKEQGE